MKLSTTLLTMVFAACGMMPCAAFELKSDHADKDIIISIADDTLHVNLCPIMLPEYDSVKRNGSTFPNGYISRATPIFRLMSLIILPQ